jgi:hypothetical protein
MTPQDFATRTRADRQEFDAIRQQAFEETAQEKTARETTEKKHALLQVQQKLATV